MDRKPRTLQRFRLATALAAAVLLASSLGPGVAQGILRNETGRLRTACMADYQRFCLGVPPLGGRILQCLNQHAESLSQPCFQALTVWGLAAANAFRACLPDAARLCAHVPPGGGRGLACILQNADQLSRACRDALAGQEFFNGPLEPRKGK